ncbi:MAG: apolipoprotein N-acyltransferase [Acidobacteriota bacterium]
MKISPSWRELAASASLAIGGAVLWSLCFTDRPSMWLPWVALAPLFLLLGRRHVVIWGALYAILLWLTSMSWIAGTLGSFGGLSSTLALVTQWLLALYLGFDQVVFVLLGSVIWRRSRAGSWLHTLWAIPALWVAIEWLRGVAFGRFPWNLAAYAWVDVPGALPLAAWIGSFGVSFWVALVNVGIAESCRRRRWEPAVVSVLAAMTLLVLAGRFSHGSDRAHARRSAATDVRIIQPNNPIVHTWEASWEGYLRLIEMSEAECSAPRLPSDRLLLVWPESAAWPHSHDTSPRLREDVARLAEQGCDVLLGSQINEGDKAFNSALLVTNEGPVAQYSKRKLVPWGEYVPLAEVLPFLGQVARNAGSFTPGTELGLMPVGDERLGLAICYEVIFPALLAEQVAAGASVLVNTTNDAWYGDTWAPHQHFRAARFRAAENRRPLIRAALTGISGLIDRRGSVDAVLGVNERGVLSARVTGSDELTPYTRLPWLVPTACALLAALALAICWRDRRVG